MAEETFGELVERLRAHYGKHPNSLLRGSGGFVEVTREEALEAVDCLESLSALGYKMSPLERLGARLILGDIKPTR